MADDPTWRRKDEEEFPGHNSRMEHRRYWKRLLEQEENLKKTPKEKQILAKFNKPLLEVEERRQARQQSKSGKGILRGLGMPPAFIKKFL